MNQSDNLLINRLISEILSGYESYIDQFNAFSRLAPVNFRDRNWNELQQNHKKRLRLYKDLLHINIHNCKALLGTRAGDRSLWSMAKSRFSHSIGGRPDEELAESFFNSVIRKVVPNLSIDNAIMFVHPGTARKEPDPDASLFYTYPSEWELTRIFRQLLVDFDFGVPFFNKAEDIEFLEKGFREVILTRYLASEETTIQVLKNVFYRNKAAYLIGRIFIGGKWMPFLIPFVHNEKGVFVDTLIFNPNIMSGIFSYTRSYFMAEIKIPAQVISFLTSVIKNKKKHELYNAIGFNKHGKTEFYRDFLDHLASSSDQFILAPGIKGMVMTVFTLPSYNIVFKLIKDHFDPPKNMTRQQVREKYKLVSLHDRVGRMADTHEFEDFHIPLERIHPELLLELKNTANSLLEQRGDTLVIKHLYTERRMEPLNLFLEKCSLEEAKQAVEEYGNSIMQLAQANIFPGDMMVKNFGVTRQRRVVFYDYDEIEFMRDMNFRKKPRPETFEQIYASEPWYDIAPNDVFPEDFKRFMIGRTDVRDHFFEVHKHLFDPNHWKSIQDKLNQGELIHAFPYPESIRFRPHEKI
ncbi:Isocitrate dehydrogenase phosphatase /kinase [Lunatimonas lonarensis]|uniref:Isocitrate dehydrogenase phosphatase /kinase n=1 Tax=Lunatimonas lonarensis TaxID=1232681 RepID=R7ZNZ4_9BACT|nr:bifunctional isocitrate dehydrogenase kinase/phosphatase [Lunatimonas lonarensis]EON75773.1 Isocitrate dehydrogenase phosphatase /kinase [Lunatimonas lonarensis]